MEQLISLLRIDVPDHNGIIFPSYAVEEACRDFEERIKKQGGILGECSIPIQLDTDTDEDTTNRYTTIDLARVSHIVQHVWIEHQVLQCKVRLLGKYAEIAKQLDIEFFGIPRSTGTIEEGSKVCTKYTLLTVDLAHEIPELK